VNELQKNVELNPSPLLRSVAAVPCKNWKICDTFLLDDGVYSVRRSLRT